jgi:Spy/CpxP family protein refolding chaperone
MHRTAVRYVTRTTTAAGGALATAATSVAAAAVAASIIFSPVADASARMDGVSEDLLRAVQLNQITEEQAVKFEARLAGRILGGA